MIRTDDPRLSAYALGELGPEAAAEVERLLEGDPEAIAVVKDVRAMAGTLAAAFGAEPSIALTEPQRAAVIEVAAKAAETPVLALARPGGRAREPRPWFAWTLAAAAAAAGILVIGGPVQPRASSVETERALREQARLERVSEIIGFATMPGAKGETWVNVNDLKRALDPSTPDSAVAQFIEATKTPSTRTFYSNKKVPAGPDAFSGAPGYGSPDFGLAGGRGGSAPVGVGTDGSKAQIYEFRTFPFVRSAPGQSTNANWNRHGGGDVGVDLRGLGSEGGGAGAPSPMVNLDDVTNGLQEGFETTLASGPVTAGAPVVIHIPKLETAERERLSAEAYAAAAESPFLRPTDAPLSTFSIDVDTASYANVRRMITAGIRPPPDAVRLEELVNYFPYAYPAPTGTDPFAVHLETASCPWNLEHRLVRVALKGREIARKERPASNLVFLVDVSGSMDAPAKLPLVKASLRMLVDELNERDTVAIVVYAGASGVALPPTTCEKKDTIREAIDRLTPGGSTNGAAGIELAYQLAAERFVAGGVNRVILATDGDFNVGVTSHDDLLKLIETKAKSRIFLTTLGYGMGNLKDSTLEMLADKGNGTYGYVDTTREAHKLLVEEAGGTLVTIAKDVKVQVEFNPKTVGAYRLVGYDNRLLAAKDFADDTKDAGEIGAGHTVTAFYEVVPAGKPLPKPEVDPLRYQPVSPPAGPTGPAAGVSDELLTVKLRWKAPEGDVSTLRELPYTDTGAPYEKASADFRFAASVASFALVLRGSPHRGTGSYEAVLELAGAALGDDPGGWRKEFVELVGRAKTQFGEPAPIAPKAPPAPPTPPAPQAPPASPPAAPADGPVAPPR